MKEPYSRLFAACFTILTTICLCLGAITIAATGINYLREQGIISSLANTQTPEFLAVTPALPDGKSEPTGDTLPQNILNAMEEIESQVSALRGLAEVGQVSRSLLTPSELNQKITTDFLDEYSVEEAARDARILNAFGLLPKDFNLLELYRQLLGEQVAGYYDDEAETMFVVQANEFSGVQRTTYAHEFTHSLQDRYYDIENGLGYSEEQCEQNSEQCLAIQALLEGDASLVEEMWLYTHANSDDLQDLLDYYQQFESPIFDTAPVFIRSDFLFPYLAGKAFVEYVFEDSGWQAIDQVYHNLPQSTEQIMHPERYPQDVPLTVLIPELPAELGHLWVEIDQDILGEWYTYLVLSQGIERSFRLNEDEARQAAEGWAGDAYRVYQDESGEKILLILSSRWDTNQESQEFSHFFRQYATMRFGREQEFGSNIWGWESTQTASLFLLKDDQTIWVQAPDIRTAQTILQLIETH